MMEFLDGFQLLIDKLPNYDDFKSVFYVRIDKTLCNLIIESDNQQLTQIMKSKFQNEIINNINEYGEIKIIHNQRHGIGRFYPDNDISLIVQSRIIKHTIFLYLDWKDIDQVKGHPTIICEIGRLNNIKFEGIQFYIDNFNVVRDELINYYSIDGELRLDEDDIKYLFNLTIYGGAFQTWRDNVIKGDIDKGFPPKKVANKELHKYYKNFKKDVDTFKQLLLKSNIDLLNKVRDPTKTDYENENKVVSYFCGAIENHALYITYQFLVKEGIIKKHCELEYDGLCIPPFKSDKSDDEILKEINNNVFEKMGIQITYKFKGYKNVLTDAIEKRKLQIEEENKRIQYKECIKREKYENLIKELNEKYYENDDEIQILNTQLEELKNQKKVLLTQIENDNTGTQSDNLKAIEKSIKEKYNKCEKLKKERLKKVEKDAQKVIKQDEKEEIEKIKRIAKENVELMKQKAKDEKKQLSKMSKEERKKELEKKKSEEGLIILKTDNEAGEFLYNILKDRLIFENGQMFFKVGNIWINDYNEILTYLLDYILKSGICREKDDIIIPYSENITDAYHIRDALLVKTKTSLSQMNITEKLHNTTKARLCFLDGVLDFKAKRFYKWNEINFEYYSCVMINRNFNEYFNNPDMKLINLIQDKIFKTLFGNDIDTALHFLARGIAGHFEDKNAATLLGNRNCGKGVVYDALKASFEDYVATFELGNILYNRKQNNTDEISRKLYWLIDLQFRRLAVSQETPPLEAELKASGKLMKKMASGGDTHVARHNYDRVDTHFIIDTTFLIMGNNSLIFDCVDVYEQLIEFKNTEQFKTQEEIDKMKAEGKPKIIWEKYKIKDPNLKHDIQTDEWKNAIVYLLYMNYRENGVPILKEIDDEKQT